MSSFQENMLEYRRQLEKGAIQAAYKGLMDYLLELKATLKNKHPDYFVSGSLYFGYMDMTYFSFYPASIKDRGLKIAIVFVHETFRFEVWLAGANKALQAQTWKLFKENDWRRYPLVPTTRGVDAIIEHVLVANPDFSDLNALTDQIERQTMKFIQEVEDFLAWHKDPLNRLI
jgi:hypothetical protein